MKKKIKLLFFSLLLLFTLFIAFLFIPFPTHHLETRYEVIDIGTLPGENQSFASDINNLGEVVGHSGGAAFFWDPNEGMTLIADQYWETKVNDRSEVLGFINVLEGHSSSSVEWLRLWTPKGGFERSGLTSVRRSEFGFSSQSLVAWNQNPGSKFHKAFIQNVSGTAEPLALPEGRILKVLDINNPGAILGILMNSEGMQQTFVLHTEGTLEILHPGVQSESNFKGFRLNDQGIVLGSFDSPAGERGFSVWDGGEFNNLIRFGWYDDIEDMNNQSQVVGSSQPIRVSIINSMFYSIRYNARKLPYGYTIENMIGHPMTWDQKRIGILWENHYPFDLNTLISPDAGWRIIEASAINDRGEIVGYGYHRDGNYPKAFLLRPIEEE